MNSSSREGFYFFPTISGRQSATASTSLLYHIVVAQVEAVLLGNVCPSGNCFMASLIVVRHLANHFFQNFFTSEVERPPNTGKCDDPQRFLQVVDSLIFCLINSVTSLQSLMWLTSVTSSQSLMWLTCINCSTIFSECKHLLLQYINN